MIATACGAEAGTITASASAGITVAVAGCMTGADLARIERLPDTTGLERDEVVIQTGHMVYYGAPVEQAIRLAGAKVVPVGTATYARPYHLEGAIGPRTAAAVYVVSHHAVGFGQIALAEFCRVCRAHGVPVIVDAASEYDLKGFLAAGADIVDLQRPQVPGRPHRRHRRRAQGPGARGLPAERRHRPRHEGRQGEHRRRHGGAGGLGAARPCRRPRRRARPSRAVAGAPWRACPASTSRIVPDPTDNPLDRLEVRVDPAEAGTTAWALAAALAAGDPPVIVRDHEVEHGRFYLDPCNLHPGEAEQVAEAVAATLEAIRGKPGPPSTSCATGRRRACWPGRTDGPRRAGTFFVVS